MEKTIRAITRKLEQTPGDLILYEHYFECIKILAQTDKQLAFRYNSIFRKYLHRALKIFVDRESLNKIDFLHKESYHLEAADRFDSYLIFLEWNREPGKKFYLPRRKVLKRLVDDLQDLADHVIVFLGISLPPRVGKSTLCIFFMTWMMGRNPDIANVMSGHSDKLTSGFYKEILNIITDHETYLWHEVFPCVRLVDQSAKDESVDLGHHKRFPTLTCRSIEGTLTGAVEIGEGGVLYSDDLIADLEESLNPERLQTKYDAYLNQLKDRKKDHALELMVGTRWNVLDPLGRIQEQYETDPRYRFTVIPALNENDESNFDYDYGLGFSTEYYHDMRSSIDDATWWAKYMGSPYVREGLLFPKDELLYYNGVLPGVEPDRIMAVTDVAWGGGDYLSMPFAYLYDGDVYIHDVIFNDRDKSVTQPIVVGKIKQHMPHQIRMEANNGGSEYADKVDELLRAEGIHVNISSRRAPNTKSKMARMIQYAPEIKRFHFIDDQHASPEYRMFMKSITTFTVNGGNTHDDAPDSLAQLVDFIDHSYGEVTIIKRPF